MFRITLIPWHPVSLSRVQYDRIHSRSTGTLSTATHGPSLKRRHLPSQQRWSTCRSTRCVGVTWMSMFWLVRSPVTSLCRRREPLPTSTKTIAGRVFCISWWKDARHSILLYRLWITWRSSEHISTSLDGTCFLAPIRISTAVDVRRLFWQSGWLSVCPRIWYISWRLLEFPLPSVSLLPFIENRCELNQVSFHCKQLPCFQELTSSTRTIWELQLWPTKKNGTRTPTLTAAIPSSQYWRWPLLQSY